MDLSLFRLVYYYELSILSVEGKAVDGKGSASRKKRWDHCLMGVDDGCVRWANAHSEVTRGPHILFRDPERHYFGMLLSFWKMWEWFWKQRGPSFLLYY